VNDLVRRAGSGRSGDGTEVVWSVAEGRRGRRWREVRSRDGAVVSSLLLETFPDRRFGHMELSTPSGLLTLHPEADGTLHGNAVTASGIEHVVGMPWPEGALLVVDDSPIALAAAAWAASTADGREGESGAGERAAVVVDRSLRLQAASIPAAALARDAIDGDGLPVLDEGRSWSLELDAD
jgi:hypothetical protein